MKEIVGDVCRCVKRPGEIMQTDDMETHSVCGGEFVSRREGGKVSDEESATARAIKLIKNQGIAEGLRMAAAMFRASKWISFKEAVPIDGYDFYQSIMAKAKEIEESAGKGEKLP